MSFVFSRGTKRIIDVQRRARRAEIVAVRRLFDTVKKGKIEPTENFHGVTGMFFHNYKLDNNLLTVEPRAVDPHCFDADPEPDPAQNLVADPHQIQIRGGGGGGVPQKFATPLAKSKVRPWHPQ
jgi:hypothetical protein